MAIPASYTEPELADFIHTQLGDFPSIFGWNPGVGDYRETVNDTLAAYGVSNIADATDIKKLRAFARVAGWKQVLAKLASQFSFSADGASFSRAQMLEMAAKALAMAEADAMIFTPGAYSATVGTINWTRDPYKYPPDPEEAI